MPDVAGRMERTAYALGGVAGVVGTVGLAVATAYETEFWMQTLYVGLLLTWFAVAVALVLQVRRSRLLRVARDRASLMLRSLTEARRRVLGNDDAREAVVDAVIAVTHAKLALLAEPTGVGLGLTATAGMHLPEPRLSQAAASVATEVLRSGEAVRLRGANDEPDHAREAVRQLSQTLGIDVHSIVYVPVRGRDEVLGVLGAVFAGPGGELAEQAVSLLPLLAGEAAIGIEREAMVRQLQELTVTDALTGLVNLRGWRSACKGMHRSGAMLVVDLDHFKRVNDTHGHARGDLVLQAFAGVLRRTVRAEDVVARIGGEEFALLLPSGDDLEGLVERLRTAWTAEHGHVTFSGGAARRKPGEQPEEVQQRCDRALYVAKRSGRDRVLWADADTPPIAPPLAESP